MIVKYTVLLLMFTLLSAVGVAQCDPAVIYGRVELEGHAPAPESDDYYVEVYPDYEHPQKAASSEQRTKWDLYSYRLPAGPERVRLCFVSREYRTQYTDYVNIEKPNDFPIFPPVQMHRIVLKKRHASAEVLSEDLKQQAILFLITKSYDVFQYNLALLQYAYQDSPELTEALQNFMKASEAQPFMASQYANRRPLYLNMIRRSNGEDVSVGQTSLLTLMRDENAFPGIRASAIKALVADAALPPAVKQSFLDYLHQQSLKSSALLFRPAKSALAQIGTSKDKQSIISDLDRKEDPERVLAALIAIRNARLDKPVNNSESAEKAKAALDQWEMPPQAPPPSRIQYVWNNGTLAPGLKINTFTSGDIKDWHQLALDGTNPVLRVDYPAGQAFGLLQVVVTGTETTFDLSDFTELVVELRSADLDRNVDVGIKGAQDPGPQTKFKRTLLDVSTDWQEYHIPLRGVAAQLSDRAATNQLARLQRLKILTELAFGTFDRQVFYIRKIYFARP